MSALGDERLARIVRDAHDEAVDAAVAYMETHTCVVRRERGGTVRLAGGGFVVGGIPPSDRPGDLLRMQTPGGGWVVRQRRTEPAQLRDGVRTLY